MGLCGSLFLDLRQIISFEWEAGGFFEEKLAFAKESRAKAGENFACLNLKG